MTEPSANNNNNNNDQRRGKFACAIDISVTATPTRSGSLGMQDVRRYVEFVLPARVVKSYNLVNDGNRCVRGKIVFQPNIRNPKTVKSYAKKLRDSKEHFDPQQVVVQATMDETSLVQQQQPPETFESNNENDLSVDFNDEGGEVEDAEREGMLHWKNSKQVASNFFSWLNNNNTNTIDSNTDVDLASVERDLVHQLFESFVQKHPSLSRTTKKNLRRLESLIMAVLKRQKLLKTKRYSDGVVVCSFAKPDTKLFAPLRERQTARDLLLQKMEALQADKGGIHIPEKPVVNSTQGDVLPLHQKVMFFFPITLLATTNNDNDEIQLLKIRLGGSNNQNTFQIETKTPCTIPSCTQPTFQLQLSVQARATGVYRASVTTTFQNMRSQQQFCILRRVVFKAAENTQLYTMLQPKSEYVKQKRKFEKPVEPDHVFHPPSNGSSSGFKYKNLQQFKVPLDVRELVENRELESALQSAGFDDDDDTPDNNNDSDNGLANYSNFWQHLLWASELQAYEDIQLFDMEQAALQRSGRVFKLHVAGLAEGRPSVLRGDLVLCTWKGRLYRGRVFAVELLDVVMEFHKLFHQHFDPSVDRVDLVRFTFSRTAYRTSHAGCLQAPKTMGASMLLPHPKHVDMIQNQQHDERTQRKLPEQLAWISQTLNQEQKEAVTAIVAGKLRPIPSIIFGPPGTGKTTTMTEAVCQLARLHTYDRNHQKKLKILLVAPSNDAADILVEKLSPFFPPSEMMRVLAFTRTIDQVPPLARPYVREGLEPQHAIAEIAAVQIVVSTVNLAARFWCMGGGVPKGTFDVLCIDEAGHATEPEVIGVAATLMNFSGPNPGQLVLAGDPKQLGPSISSDVCKKLGIGISYMERLVETSPAYSNSPANGGGDIRDCDDDGGGDVPSNNNVEYTPELVTLLVRNYRSHPSILKLPNEMFYHNKLIPSGDQMTTHSMCNWEHLPKKGFPIVFVGVDGENCREGSSPSWFNPQEAMTVVDYVDLLVNKSRPAIRPEDIGIITPYARQVQKIRQALQHKLNMSKENIKVGSVEVFQGQERRVIIISTVRSEQDLVSSHDLRYNLGFVANAKRFNVAVTRAQALLIVIGNPRVLEMDKKNWLHLLRYCKENGSWMGQDWTEADSCGADGKDEESVSSLSSLEQISQKEISSEEEWEVVAADQEARGFINREE